MRSCVTVFLTLFGLSLVIWMGWEPIGFYYDEFRIWWRGDNIVAEIPPDTSRTQALPENALPPPVYPARQKSALRTVRVTDAIDVPYEEVDDVLNFNQILEEHLTQRYFDTAVIVSQDTIPGRDGILVEVYDLEGSRVRDFRMWNTFNLSLYHDLQPNSMIRVHLDLTGVYREQFMPEGWSAQRSEEIRYQMRQSLQNDARDLLNSLDSRAERRNGSFRGW